MRKLFISSIVILFTFTAGVSQSLLDKQVHIDQFKGTVEEALTLIGEQANFTFSYSNLIELRKETSLIADTKTVRAWLDEIFGKDKVTYFINADKIILRPVEKSQVQLNGYFILRGHVQDSVSGEVLIGASIFINELSTGVSSNAYGFFSLSVPQGTHTLTASFIGFKTWTQTITFSSNTVLDIPLAPISQQLDEVSIKASDSDLAFISPEFGTHQLTPDIIKKIPALSGEVDVLRALQLLPGVKNASEASTNFSVRGGNLDQNLILLDEAPVYNPSHVIGVFSTFNTDAIKDMQFFKGVFPSEYGGRLSSVVDLKMKDGNEKKIVASGGIGLISSRLTVEGPIKKNRSSFLVSARYTYSDAITQSIKFMRQNNFRFYFFDLNLKTHYTFNSRNKLFLSAYAGEDVNRLGYLDDIKWKNSTATLRWNHIFKDNLFSNTTILYSAYHYNILTGYLNPFKWNSSIQDVTFKSDVTFFINHSSTLKFGFASTHHKISPGKGSSPSGPIALGLSATNSLEHGIYVNHEQQISGRILAQYGVRYSLFQNIGRNTTYSYNEAHEVTDTTFHNNSGAYNAYGGLEPRVLLRYSINESSAVKIGYGRTYQYLQLISNSTFGLSPFDTWFASNANLKPQKADQITAGYFKNVEKHGLELSAEIYYKWLYNQVEYANHAQLLFNPHLEGELRTGKGYAYGIEILAKKNTGQLTGWISYNYSRARKNIPEISVSDFNANYDQPHAIAVVGNYVISKRLSISGNWVYATGRPTTLPKESFGYKNFQVPVYGERNGTRLPDYHRLDLALTIHSREKPSKNTSHNWVFSIYNVYARNNPFFIFTSPPFADFTSKTGYDAYKISILPFLPSVTYNFKFK